MAAVVELVWVDIAPVASLHVNDWNDAARRTYEKAGFRETAPLRDRHVLMTRLIQLGLFRFPLVACICEK
jgi:hypothetical protein